MEVKSTNSQADKNLVAEQEQNIETLLRFLGDDPDREGLRDTPKRYIKFLQEFLNPPSFNLTTFTNEGGHDMVVQTDIPFYSICEHHLAPFFGTATVAYLPKQRIVGLSKLARTVQHFGCRLQNQERITKQVADLLESALEPEGVAVVLKARHLCMEMRGVKAHPAQTTTSRMVGGFFDNASARSEFFEMVR